jgi:subtilisin family serine protease
MVDTGFYRHPYYTDPSVHSWAIPNVTTHSVLPTSDPNTDEYGHGTAIASNVFAIAPECEFHHIKDDDDPLAALALARDLKPDVLSLSWGWFETYVQDQFDNLPDHGATLYLREIETEINGMVDDGTVVFCASGNGKLPGNWPSSMPDVVSVGGAFIDEHLKLTASSYATSFASRIYTTDNNEPRHCPDVCGLVGPEPRGLLLAMPTQPRNNLDADFSRDDGTRPGDGWMIASGTSSATPQVAAMAALLIQLCGPLSPVEVRQHLEEMAVCVHDGYTATGHRPWGNRPNIATGYGFVTLRRPQLYEGYTGLY